MLSILSINGLKVYYQDDAVVKYLTLLLICSLLAACGADSRDQVQPIVFTEVDPSDYIIVEDQDFSRTFSISRPGTGAD